MMVLQLGGGSLRFIMVGSIHVLETVVECLKSYILTVRGSKENPRHRGFEQFFKKSGMKAATEVEESQQEWNARSFSPSQVLRAFPQARRNTTETWKEAVCGSLSDFRFSSILTLFHRLFTIQRHRCGSLCSESPLGVCRGLISGMQLWWEVAVNRGVGGGL